MTDAIQPLPNAHPSPAIEGAPPVVATRRAEPGAGPVETYLAHLGSTESRRVMLGSLDLLARLLSRNTVDARRFPWWRMRYEDAQATRAWLAEHYAPASVNRHLAALRGVLKECWRLQLMTREAYERAADVQVVRNVRPPAGRMLAREEIAELFKSAAGSAAPERDTALLAIAYATGLRRAEIAAIDLADLDLKTGKLTVHGKGNKVRVVFVPPGALKHVAVWVKERGNWPGPLLTPINKSGVAQRTRLSVDGVEHVLSVIGKGAGVAHFGPHDLRRTYISEMLDRGVDLALVQKIAGHQRPETTSRYDRRPEDRKRKAAALLDVPAV